MLKFIADNKEWFFPALGLFLGLLGAVIRWLYNKHNKALVQGSSGPVQINIAQDQSRSSPIQINQPQININQSILESGIPGRDDYSEHPTPKEIQSEIEKAPPFQQHDISKHYVGLKIKWPVRLTLVHKTEGDIAILSCTYSDILPYVHIQVDLSKYPRFKTMKRGESFLIYGQITEMETLGGILIKPDQIVFNN